MTTHSYDREVAIREIFKKVLGSLGLAISLYELHGRDPDGDLRGWVSDLRETQDMGRGAYRDIFCADEWRHDREGATKAIAEVLKDAGIAASEGLCIRLVDTVMRTMPGGADGTQDA